MFRFRFVFAFSLPALAGAWLSGPLRLGAQAAPAPTAPAAAAEPVDLQMVMRIRDEGLNRSQVMQTVEHLTDVIGPRLTGSPALKEANEWTRRRLAGWGLANAHLEAWKFGRGWSWSHSRVAMVEPRQADLLAYPKAWSPGTAGQVRGTLVKVELRADKDFDRYRGKLAGKVLLLDPGEPPRSPERELEQAHGRRLSAADLEELSAFTVPAERTGEAAKRRAERTRLRKAQRKFLSEEKALATVESSSLSWGEMGVSGTGFYKQEDGPGVPAFVMAKEPYHMLERLLEAGHPVELELELAAQYYDGDPMAYNTVAEIPGRERGTHAGELVMAGAHLDSWHTGTGATDNAAGCAVVMEAVRILNAVGVKPRRTIRVALWTGEEEGLLGSVAYVGQHFASRPEPRDPAAAEVPAYMREDAGPLQLKPEYGKLSAYFNVDNGSGRVRGIYAQENVAARPVFQAWLAPFQDLGATTVALRSVGSTDHVPFDRAGLPAFQFIQDPLDYTAHTHHTSMDLYDHLEREDLMQASVVLAAFLYDAAMRPEMLPRKPLPPPPVRAGAARPEAAGGSKEPASER